MCGIVGIVHKDCRRRIEEPVLAEMRDLLIHRGPDDAGLYIDGHAGLGHRRLSIIDISSGHQPMTNEDETLWLVFNGEIYNFKSLRDSLLEKGHRFKTKSDTEVILHLYEEKGADCVNKLNGIFAFAIWDTKNQSLFLARDHMGVKPLYYAVTDEAFLFSSEIKAIVKSGYVEPRCRDESLFEYFMFRFVSGEHTLFEGVKTLPPASTLLLKNNRVNIKQYWSPLQKERDNQLSFENASEELSWLLEDAVRMQMISDVPLGTFCSGGLDSSMITAFAARVSEKPINTFSVGFYENEYDETKYAQHVSMQYGTTHHEVKLSNQEFTNLLPQMIWQNDEPLNFANSVQIYAISKHAKEFVTVVLTGEGSDELFAGYPRYFIPQLSAQYKKLPSLLKSMALKYARHYDNHRLEKIHKYSFLKPEEVLLYNSSYLDRNFLSGILKNGYQDKLDYRMACIYEGLQAGLDTVTNMILLDQKNYLVSILHRQDKMSMAASIESRVPFLDYRIVEYSNKLPAQYKMKNFQTKYILKKIAKSILPEKIIKRRKSGFGIPLQLWLNDSRGLGRYLDYFNDDTPISRHINKRVMEQLVKEHKAGHQDHSEFLWTLINIMIWMDTYISNASTAKHVR